jgi:hypothetical protein
LTGTGGEALSCKSLRSAEEYIYGSGQATAAYGCRYEALRVLRVR